MPQQPTPPTPNASTCIDLGAKLLKQTSNKADSSDAYQFLHSLSVFSQVPASELKVLADSSRLVNLDPGQYISIEGDEEGSFGFIVVSGRVAMLKTSISGKELMVELLQSGDLFGLLLMLAAEKVPLQLSARSLQKSKVLWVPSNNFKHLVKANPILLEEFVSHLLLCLQSSYGLARGLAHDRVEVRIAAILTSLALKFSDKSAVEANTIQFTRQQLADLTGTTPETAIRVTRAMQHQGIIEIKRPGVIRILNLQALQELVEA